MSIGAARMPRRGWIVLVCAAAVMPLGLTTAGAAGFVDPVAQAQNLAVSQEREAQYDTPRMLAGAAKAIEKYQAKRAAIDPGRAPNPNSCTSIAACPIDPRLTAHRWRRTGGIVHPVLYTARSGATLSGHVWATKAGPAKRPGVVIINGSVVGLDQVYWYLAQALARAGFVVMSFDAQGEGMSDQYGQAPDQDEGAYAGTPGLGMSDELGGSGLPFYDGGEDSLDYFLSTPRQPYQPVPSRTTHTSHARKQRLRVRAGLDSAYNPLWRLLDRHEVGLTGHSYGAEAASWLAQKDPRVQAAVALDNLCVPVSPSPSEVVAIANAPINLTGLFGLPTECFGSPPGAAPKLRKPALGISSDYLLDPQPYTVEPNPRAKSRASIAYSNAGVDSGQIVIRGGTHFEFNDTVTGVIPASRRGIDLTTWYAVAWFDKYLKHDPRADRMLLTTRWRDDQAGKRVDPAGDANVFSYLYDSRLDIGLSNGHRFNCASLRHGCGGQFSPHRDCGSTAYSFIGIDTARTPPFRCQGLHRETP